MRTVTQILWVCAQVQAEVTITCDLPEVMSRQECLLRAEVSGDPEHAWRWSLRGPAGFSHALKPVSSGEARFLAPPTQTGGTFTVVVEDDRNPSVRGECLVRVVPNFRLGRDPWPTGDALLTGTFTPSLAPWLGDPATPDGGRTGWPKTARIAFCDDAFGDGPKAMRRLNRCWIMAGAQGLQAFTLAGEPVPWPGAAVPGACRALAVRPPGCGPWAEGAPRLVYSLPGSGLESDRIFALDAAGAPRELVPGDPGRRPVRDLALDREGTVYVAFSDDRAITRIDAAGKAALHARLPGPAAEDKAHPGGILAMILDPATGDLYAGDDGCLWKVAPAGTVSVVIKRCRADHLALHGRELLLLDARRQELRAFHLDSRRQALVLASAGPGAPTRLGPIHGLHPDLPEEQCAALGSAGPLAIAQEGLGILASGEGFAALDLPQEAIACKKEQRRLRRLAAQERDDAAGHRAQAAPPERKPGAGRTLRAARSASRPSAGGWFCMALLGLGTLFDPSLQGSFVLGAPTSSRGVNVNAMFSRYAADAEAGFDRLGPACGRGPLAGTRPAPCAPGYRDSVFAQIASLRGQAESLLVDPPVLGAGSCRGGETKAEARLRVTLTQSDHLASYDGFAGAANTLGFQLIRDGFTLMSAGEGLGIGQSAAAAGGGLAGAVASLVLGETAIGLDAGGFGLQTVGYTYGRLASQAIAFKANYQRWANNQIDAVLGNCTRTPAPASSGSSAVPLPVPALESPRTALEDAMDKLESGCAIAQQHELDLAVCSPENIGDFRERNGTIYSLYAEGIPCLSARFLNGRQADCPHAPLAEANFRSDLFTYFDQFFGEVSAAAFDTFAMGGGLLTGALGLVEAGNAAASLGNGTGANGLILAGHTLAMSGNALFADGTELQRIGALAQRWEANVTLALNAESRSRLDRREALAPVAVRASSTGVDGLEGSSSGSPTGTGGSLSSSAMASGTDAGPGSSTAASTGSTGGDPAPGSSTAPEQGDTSGAARTLPFAREWARWFWTRLTGFTSHPLP